MTWCPASARVLLTIRENSGLEVRPSQPTMIGLPGVTTVEIAPATRVTNGAVSF